MIKYFKAKQILEIGTSLGIGTAYLVKANPEAQVFTCAGCPESAKKMKILGCCVLFFFCYFCSCEQLFSRSVPVTTSEIPEISRAFIIECLF